MPFHTVTLKKIKQKFMEPRRNSRFRKTARILLDLIDDVSLDKNVLRRELWKAVRQPNSKELRKLLLNKDVDINAIYKVGGLKNYNLFQIVCSQIQRHKTHYELEHDLKAKRNEFLACGHILLNNGIDITYKENIQEYKAIDFANLSGEITLVEHVLQIHEEKGIPYKMRHMFCIIVKSYSWGTNVTPEHIAIMEYLMSKDVDINIFDHKTGEPAIYLAAKNKLREVVELFLNKCPDIVDIDYYVDDNKKSARNFILKYHLHDGTLPAKDDGKYSILFKAIYEKNIVNLIESYRYREMTEAFSMPFKVNLLFRALNSRAPECFEFLFDEVSEFFRNYYDILEVATLNGYFKIVDNFLEISPVSYDIKLIRKLVTISKVIVDDENSINHITCLAILLESIDMDLNVPDEYGVTVLEYAIRCNNPKMIDILLKNGSSLVLRGKNKEFVSLISDISPQIIQKYFDACIIPEEDEKQILKCMQSKSKNKTIVYDYMLDYNAFIPPIDEPPLQELKSEEIVKIPEIVVVREKQKTEDKDKHKEVVEKSLDERIYVPEMVVFQAMADSEEYHKLFVHPMALIFISMKWYRLRYYFYSKTIIDLIFMITLNGYLLNSHSNICFWIACAVFFLVLVVELFTMAIFGKEYFCFFENLWKFILLLLTTAVLVFHFAVKDVYWNQLYCCVALVSIINLFIILGNYIWFTLSVIMIKTIYFSLLRAFFTYSVLLLAFSTCLHILHRDHETTYFHNYFLSIFKTILMTTGDLSIDTLDLPNRPVGYFITIFFIFLISIALMNLLTGLAVSDIQEIMQKSRIYSQIDKVNLIRRLERVINKKRVLKMFPVLRSLFIFDSKDDEYNVMVDVESDTVLVKGHKSHKIYSYAIKKLVSVMKQEDDEEL